MIGTSPSARDLAQSSGQRSAEPLSRRRRCPRPLRLSRARPRIYPHGAAFVRKFPYKIVYFDLPEVVHVLAFA